jgi:hypothetical protein
LFEKFDKTFSKHFFDDQKDAVQRALSITEQREKLREQKDKQLGVLREEMNSAFDPNSDQI